MVHSSAVRSAAPSPTPQAQAPIPTGRTLAQIPRGSTEELRVALDEFAGHRYVALRLWRLDRRSGEWWPVKGKGVSIRLGELAEVVEALEIAANVAGVDLD